MYRALGGMCGQRGGPWEEHVSLRVSLVASLTEVRNRPPSVSEEALPSASCKAEASVSACDVRFRT